MHKFIFSLVFLAILKFAISEDEKYTIKYDNIDVDSIINNPRILKNYMNCVLNDIKCTAEGKELQKNIPDALKTNCSKCSEKQKEYTDKILKYIIENEEEYWKTLQEKYDSDGKYTKNYIGSDIQQDIQINKN